jgi:hypothetical protein
MSTGARPGTRLEGSSIRSGGGALLQRQFQVTSHPAIPPPGQHRSTRCGKNQWMPPPARIRGAGEQMCKKVKLS